LFLAVLFQIRAGFYQLGTIMGTKTRPLNHIALINQVADTETRCNPSAVVVAPNRRFDCPYS
jgi:hypothetical protein